MKPIRILQYGVTANLGGVEMFIMNIYRNIDRSLIQFDFLLYHNQSKLPFEDEILSLGGRIFRVTYGQKESIIKAHKCLDDFFQEHKGEFSGIHMHCCFITYALPLKYAKKYNIPIRIYHSHNAGDMYPSKLPLKKIISDITRYNVKKWSTDLFACSNLAGKYMFHCDDAKWIKNAINIKDFQFNEDVRNKLRKEYNLQDKKVIGFVGRLQYQKNPLFLIDIFQKINQMDKDAMLVIIGNGELESEVRHKINEFGLEDNVLMLGQRYDVNKWYQAMDCFLLPSRFEGLGIVLIEAQCSGLPCVATDNVIPNEVKILDNFIFLDKNSPIDMWAYSVISSITSLEKNCRNVAIQKIKMAGFDIHSLCDILKNYYLANL